jgi:hypothetical protein
MVQERDHVFKFLVSTSNYAAPSTHYCLQVVKWKAFPYAKL